MVEQAFLPVNNPVNDPENACQENTCQTGMSDPHVYEQNNEIKKIRRHLPHWTMRGIYYFITFRKKDAPLFTQNDRKIIYYPIQKGNKKFYYLICSIVMLEHVHIILKPNENYNLSRVMKGIKKNMTAGSVWQDETFDRIIRDEKN